MKPLTEQWCEKAQEDWILAERELDLEPPVYGAICFHAQQSAEKYLKALTSESGLTFGRTHDLEYLARQLGDVIPELGEIEEDLRWLTQFAVEVRYPGISAKKKHAERAIEVAKKVRELVLQILTPPCGT